MAFVKFIILLVAALASFGRAAPRDCSKACEGLYDIGPVCGHDWNTYSSVCALRKTACETKKPIVIVYRGRCVRGPQVRPAQKGDKYGCIKKIDCDYSRFGPNKKPVCGSDGQRYSNECNLKKRACFSRTAIIPVSTIGQQQTRCYNSVCPKCGRKLFGIGVCGSDGVYYQSRCHLRKAACEKMQAITALYYAYSGHC